MLREEIPDPQRDRAGSYDVVCIVVSYRTASRVDALLSTIIPAKGSLRVGVIVVDNSHDVELPPVIERYAFASLIVSDWNRGYAGAINLAMASVSATRWLAIINPDLVLSAGGLELAVRFGNSSGHACVVPRVVDSSGRRANSLRSEPSIANAVGEALFGDHWPRRPQALAEIVRDDGAYSRCTASDWAVGAFVLVRADLAKDVGPWDERFFLYSEETDYMRRIRANGGEVVLCDSVEVEHEGGGSGRSADLAALLQLNRIRYYRKWHGPAASAVFASAVLLGLVLRARRRPERVALKALVSRGSRSASLRRVNFPGDWSWS